jgi:cytochrome d ubiquinol oxidase subunit I
MGTLMLMCRRAVEIEEITTEEREVAKAKIQPTAPDPSTV